MHQIWTAAFALTFGATLLSACGSSNPPSTTTTSTTTTTTPKAALASCQTGLLHIVSNFGGTAAGVSYYRFVATNSSPSTCTIDGYPSLAFFAPSAAGGAGSSTSVSLSITKKGSLPTKVTLKHGASSEFLLTFTDEPVDGAGCTSVGSVNVTPPNQTASIPVALSFTPCGGEVEIQPFALPGTQNP